MGVMGGVTESRSYGVTGLRVDGGHGVDGVTGSRGLRPGHGGVTGSRGCGVTGGHGSRGGSQVYHRSQ